MNVKAMSEGAREGDSYVLVTPARNEAPYIQATLESVVSQTILPRRWVIVSDGSSDDTDEIIGRYAKRYSFIDFVRRETQRRRDFASKVHAFNLGFSRLDGLNYGFVGNQDADCSFGRDYYEQVLSMFAANECLGIAGGVYYECVGGSWLPQRTNTSWSVTGGIQLFRRECYEDVGGYLPLSQGGVDSAAEVMARLHGWEVRGNRALVVFHHRRTGCAKGGIWKARFVEGRQEYLLGYLLRFEVLKQLCRITERPLLSGSVIKLAGYLSLWFVNAKRCLPDNAVRFLQQEQKGRISALRSKAVLIRELKTLVFGTELRTRRH